MSAALPEPGTDAAAPPVMVARPGGALWLTSDGEVFELTRDEAVARLRDETPLLCHGRATARRLGIDPFRAYDILELLVFVRPARFCVPTPTGIAQALGLAPQRGAVAEASLLPRAAQRLLQELAAGGGKPDHQALDLGFAMTQAGWLWGPAVMRALGTRLKDETPHPSRGFAVWESLAEWSEHAPEPPPGSEPVTSEEARERLAELVGEDAESRPQQADYASAAAQAFQPRERPGEPRLVLAEAGTGVGKTLGYIAPASVWAQKNQGPVWLSTFTRNLQHQIDGELDRLYPRRADKELKVVIRKGRENYLCLLNLADKVRGIGAQLPGNAIALALLARWAASSRDGDMVGGDFPAWLADLTGRGRTFGLTDRRGECIYSACEFYRKCFIERSIRRARRAELVVANHALVMIQAALGGEEGALPRRYVFDEGHHIFDAADNAFSAHLSGQETYELRRWLLGAEGTRSSSASRLRGLKRRLEDFIAADEDLGEAVSHALRATRALAAEGWHQRLAEGRPSGPLESFLSLVRQQVLARAGNIGEGYSLECEPRPPVEGLAEAASALDEALAGLQRPLTRVDELLSGKLDDEAAELDSETRRRIEAILRGLRRRGTLQLGAWRDMLATLEGETPEAFVDWFAIERGDGRELDVGFHRHWIDPTEPFAAAVLEPTHGAVITSATLTDRSGDIERDWQAAETRVGSLHLPNPAIRAQVPSPFDYPAQTRIFVVTDVRKDDLDQVGAAVRELFLASGGGALGLFTAISRLRGVHRRIAGPLDEAGAALLAQHVDGLDVSTLVEIFRAETDSCLLGTDAVRDGVDVPGRSLRLIVFDRVPWPRPDLRHKARRERFGGRAYDEMLTRLKLRQAFGRLVRRADDQGVFVLLDPMMPSRFASAFPEGVEVQRVGLAEAVAQTRAFLTPSP